jgi:hypothetical protein
MFMDPILFDDAVFGSVFDSLALLSPGRTSAPATEPAASASDAPPAGTGRMSVIAIEDRRGLDEWIPQWEELATVAMEPNVFYEPWLVLPALDAFGRDGKLIHLFVTSSSPSTPPGRPVLCGYFPLERARGFRGIASPMLMMWKHIHCFLCTPLLRQGYAKESLRALIEWARSDPRGAAIVQFPQVTADGHFRKSLIDSLEESGRPAFIYGTYNRALFVPRDGVDEYLRGSLSRKSRKQLGRQMRRMSEVGKVEFDALGPAGDFETWVQNFLSLEASGWKGRATSALACHDSDRRFFTSMAREAFRRGRLMMIGMLLDGRPVAMKCNLLAGDGSFSFKIAFDETYARFSPGVLLEVENIRRLHSAPSIRWMDSCAVSNHSMANRLWIDRRTIQNFAIATGRGMSDFLVSAMPLIRWLAHKFTRHRRDAGRETDGGIE